MKNFKIPAAFQLVIDDLGWMLGEDERVINKPSRTGMPRRHVLEDYMAVEEIGKAANMKFGCTFVIGDWDRHNLLRKVPRSSWLGDKWDSSKWLNIEEAEKMRDYINSCKYIEMGFHGLQHEMWDDNGKYIGGQEYFIPENDTFGNKVHLAPESFLRCHFDTFMKIFNDWGFTQKIKHFVAPGDCNGSPDADTFAEVLKDYGVRYWHNCVFKHCEIKSGIMINRLVGFLAHWAAYDLDPRNFKIRSEEEAGILMSHWPNWLRYDPSNNLERINDWKDYFDRQSQVYGVIMSREVEFAHHQLLYKEYAKVEINEDEIIIDLTKADEVDPYEVKHPLYVSFKNGSEPTECIGGKMSLYEIKNGFKNYKIDRTDAKIIRIK